LNINSVRKQIWTRTQTVTAGTLSDSSGLCYRPVRQQLTLRLDADVVAWFKSHTTSNEGHHTWINRALRE
jgi:uncharacterized protein (DUF4415 family)